MIESLKCAELRLGRQRAVDQQIGDFQIAGFLRQLFHRITAVQEHARIAVDIGDLALGAGRGHESGSNVNTPCSLVRLRYIEHVGSDRPDMAWSSAVFPVREILEFVFRAHSLCPTGLGFTRLRNRSLARPYNGIKRIRRECGRRARDARARACASRSGRGDAQARELRV